MNFFLKSLLFLLLFVVSCSPPAPLGKAITSLPSWASAPGNVFLVERDVIYVAPSQSVDVGLKVNNQDFIWKKGYYCLHDGSTCVGGWMEYNFSEPGFRNTNWIKSPTFNASASIRVNYSFAGKPVYVIAYGCKREAGGFNCNRNSLGQFAWMINAFSVVADGDVCVDGGNDFYVKHNVTIYKQDGQVYMHSDECVVDGRVQEQMCGDSMDYPGSKNFFGTYLMCPNGCSDGACLSVSPESSESACTSSGIGHVWINNSCCGNNAGEYPSGVSPNLVCCNQPNMSVDANTNECVFAPGTDTNPGDVGAVCDTGDCNSLALPSDVVNNPQNYIIVSQPISGKTCYDAKNYLETWSNLNDGINYSYWVSTFAYKPNYGGIKYLSYGDTWSVAKTSSNLAQAICVTVNVTSGLIFYSGKGVLQRYSLYNPDYKIFSYDYGDKEDGAFSSYGGSFYDGENCGAITNVENGQFVSLSMRQGSLFVGNYSAYNGIVAQNKFRYLCQNDSKPRFLSCSATSADVYVKGNITYGGTVYTDYCGSSTKLNKYSCYGSTVISDRIKAAIPYLNIIGSVAQSGDILLIGRYFSFLGNVTTVIPPAWTINLSEAIVRSKIAAIPLSILEIDGDGQFTSNDFYLMYYYMNQYYVDENSLRTRPVLYSCNCVNGECVVSPGESPNAVCGSLNNASVLSKPTSAFCNVGVNSSVTGQGPWNWTCSYGSSVVSCSANFRVACGVSNDTNSAISPSLNLCNDGSSPVISANPSTASAENWTWSCGSDSCISFKNAKCGLSNQVLPSEPATGLCEVGSPTSVASAGNYWNWNCFSGSSTVSCSVLKGGSCGTAISYAYSNVPAANLCNQGTPSSVLESSMNYSWTCTLGSGATKCFANRHALCGYADIHNGNQIYTSAPSTAELCTAGKPTVVSPVTNAWSWGCGANSPANSVTCLANNPSRAAVDCGLANNSQVNSKPTTNLCPSGVTPSTVNYNTGMFVYYWTCGSSTTQCTARQSAQCSSANNGYTQIMPTYRCNFGTSSSPSFVFTTWSWTCTVNYFTGASNSVSCQSYYG